MNFLATHSDVLVAPCEAQEVRFHFAFNSATLLALDDANKGRTDEFMGWPTRDAAAPEEECP
jgi:hypothetical protein